MLVMMLIVLIASFVYAVTLTADSTDRVEIHTAIEGKLCKESDCGRFIGGIASVFPKGGGDPVNDFVIFAFRDNIYRAITSTFVRHNTTNELIASIGKCSILDPTAEYGERNIDCRYMIGLNESRIINVQLNFDTVGVGERFTSEERSLWNFYNDVEGFPHTTNNYKLRIIEDTVSNIVWKPGEETLG